MSPRNRFYGLALLGSSLLWGGAFVLQDRANSRASRRVQAQIAELSASIKAVQSSSVVAAPSSPAVASKSSTGRFPYRVLGSGRSGQRWAYLDIRHVDGSKRRYYSSLDEGQRGLDRMMREIDLDALDAEYGVLMYSDPVVASSGSGFSEYEN